VQKKAEVNLSENAVYRVIDGENKKVDKPGDGFGKQVITWQDGKPTHYEVSYTKR
jgi:hypothetical protein